MHQKKVICDQKFYFPKKNFYQNIFQTKILFHEPKTLGLKFFLTKIFFWPKVFLDQKRERMFFGPKNVFWTKNFFFGPKILGPIKFLVPKNFGRKKISSKKKYVKKKNFGLKKNFLVHFDHALPTRTCSLPAPAP